ncbi:ABC transporter ATP-binding protein [Reyranella soli]|jgi:oligopeptide/dipeptide ABC transporter ATP-binding protein|uniref:ABC transporter ATP-binding protein n=1 Tax=Reyranella soli TaxID=1230389 RepID=A0A512NJN5_9HYPH|nr:ABC transporter ATP-binding protein [Reyranella soli]GEP59156.1 ABC transporter ATP-binding protein [Reyranella soli]
MTAAEAPLVSVTAIRRHFVSGGGLLARRKVTRAVDDVSFGIAAGETLGLVGESGSGKSTLGRVIVGLLAATSGQVAIAGQAVGGARGGARRALWRRVQMVFQDPYSSLNPRLTVRDTLAEPLRNFGIARGADADRRIREALDACGLPASAMTRHPREFSGGQRQRIGIARALIVRPDFIVADEPVSALDVSIQAQIINLLQDLKAAFGLTYLFIAHDLAVVRHVSDRVAVMYRGKLVETASAEMLYARPAHPYTQLLLRSVPMPDPRAEAERRKRTAASEIAHPQATAGGCPFHARCPKARFPLCGEQAPPLAAHASGHRVACHFPG